MFGKQFDSVFAPETDQTIPAGLQDIRKFASGSFVLYLWAMAAFVTVLAGFWSDHWVFVGVAVTAIAAVAHFYQQRDPTALQTRLFISVAMVSNWIFLVYSVSGIAGGEYILDAHMVYFILNAMLLAYFCPLTILTTNVIVVLHHVTFSVFLPSLIWPGSDSFRIEHFFTHAAMVCLILPLGLYLSVRVSTLFQESRLSLIAAEREAQTAQNAIAQAEKASAEREDARQKVEFETQERARREAEAERENHARLEAEHAEREQLRKRADDERKENMERQERVVVTLGDALKRLSEGDLASEITSKFPAEYEMIRSNFNAAVESLRDTVGAVANNVESIRDEIAGIGASADDLSRRTERQAATLEETAAAMDELTSSVRSAAKGAGEANEMSKVAQKNADQGSKVAHLAVAAMDEINLSSQKISKITSVIEDIAFQTNLLALNAGVEAARAGDAGRGFAVVATEVRALAQRSSEAAGEINDLIATSGQQVVAGVDLVEKTGKALKSIVTSIVEISNRVEGIAASAQEQANGLDEINSAVTELDHVTQQNAAMFEETSAASSALKTDADSLAQAVSRFTFGFSDAARPKRPEAHRIKPVAKAPVRSAKTSSAAVMKVTNPVRTDNGWDDF